MHLKSTGHVPRRKGSKRKGGAKLSLAQKGHIAFLFARN